ncbi:hypothetical protein MUK42_16406 [Musa troglodytarum]|uniref:Cathepsin propeptide inhibitor domain-containing protein n=1 Tax=Musa troglodytarum TaxID=320322 RepID=A0A9E7KQ48_9LILI|nr:hypothetical protein MUK42_16406 [Musa troglodytarum]
MRRAFLFAAVHVALAFATATSIPITGDDIASEEKLWDLYERWQSHHGVSRSVDEKRIRFDIFKENANYVFASNKRAKPYKLSLNKFGDLAREEFKRTTLSGSASLKGCFLYKNVTNVTPTVDRRQKEVAQKARKIWGPEMQRGISASEGLRGIAKKLHL